MQHVKASLMSLPASLVPYDVWEQFVFPLFCSGEENGPAQKKTSPGPLQSIRAAHKNRPAFVRGRGTSLRTRRTSFNRSCMHPVFLFFFSTIKWPHAKGTDV